MTSLIQVRTVGTALKQLFGAPNKGFNMHFSDCPRSEPILASGQHSDLTNALGKILGNSQDDVFYILPIKGLPFSARILSREKIDDGVCVNEAFPSSMDVNVGVLARELLLLNDPDSLPPARYSPPERDGMSKGWEIRRGVRMGENIAIVYAAWV